MRACGVLDADVVPLRNLLPDPTFVSPGTTWFGIGTNAATAVTFAGPVATIQATTNGQGIRTPQTTGGMPCTPGTTYTFSADVTNVGANAVNLRFEWWTAAGVFLTSNIGSNYTTAGRAVVTAVAPATAAWMNVAAVTAVIAATGTVTIKRPRLVANIVDTSVGDSRFGSLAIRNRAVNPRAVRFAYEAGGWTNNRWTSYTSYALITGATDGPIGITTYARATVTATRAGLGFHLSDNPEAGTPGAVPKIRVKEGETVTVSIFLRSSFTAPWQFKVRPTDGNLNWTGSPSSGLLQTVPAGQWRRLSMVYTAPVGTVDMSALIAAPTVSLPVGTVFEGTGLMVSNGSTVPDYADGSSPGWRWIGTADQSESVGYPQFPNKNPDPDGMTGWSAVPGITAGGGTPGVNPIPASDPLAVPGCPFPSFIPVHYYDTRVSSFAQWAPATIGYNEWIVEGWAAAPAGVTTKLLGGGMRYGDSYANNATNGTFSGAYTQLSPANYRTWKPFRFVFKGWIPTGAVPQVSPNMGGREENAGPAWQIAGVTFRRNRT